MSHQSHHKHKGKHGKKGKGNKKSLSDQTNNNEGANNDDLAPAKEVDAILELSESQIEELRNNLNNTALPILLGTDGNTNKWKLHSGKTLETGLFYCGEMPGHGTFWKLEFMIDCPAEIYHKSINQDFDVSWIPYLTYSKVLKKMDSYSIMQQRIQGAAAVSDRDVLFIQFNSTIKTKKTPTSPEETTYYGLVQSIPDGYYNPVTLPNCVRAEYLPQGWCWTPVVEDGKIRCHSVLIYNLDLKGLLPKIVVNLAATTFLSRHVKAAQQHGLNLAAAAAGSAIIHQANNNPQ